MFEFIVEIMQTVSKQYQCRPDTAENTVFTGFSGLLHSFPLDRGDGFRRQVVQDAVDALDLGKDPVDDVFQERIGDLFDRGAGGVDRVDRTDDDRPSPGALVVLDTGGAVIGNGGEVLPHLTGKPVLLELFAQDRVGFAHGFEAVAGDRAGAADAETGAGERLTVDHAGGKTEFTADAADLVLVEELDRLDQLELQICGKTADVVVRLHADALEDIGVDGALSQELDPFLFSRLFLEDANELGADDLALLFGIADARQFVKETVDGVDVHQVGVELVAENADHLFGFALAEQTVVDVDADQVLADRLDQQRGADRRVDAARQSEQAFAVPDLFFERGDLFVDERLGKFGGVDAFHAFGTDVVLHWFDPPIVFLVSG